MSQARRERRAEVGHSDLEVLTVNADGEQAIMFYEPYVTQRLRLGATWDDFEYHAKKDLIRFQFTSDITGMDTHLDVFLDQMVHTQLWHGFTGGSCFFLCGERIEEVTYNVPVVRISYDAGCSAGLAKKLSDTLRRSRLRYLDVVA